MWYWLSRPVTLRAMEIQKDINAMKSILLKE
jgi:hypothetical protein